MGTDYDDPAQVEAYDTRHAQFRDIDAECSETLDRLGVTPQSALIEMGTGTGTLAIHAARRCATVYAIDVSRQMLEFARQKAVGAGLGNIVFCHGGFLTYDHAYGPVDAMATGMAFHHLPDFWKGIALRRMNNMLKLGGQLYINDVIFEDTNVAANISRWITHLAEIGGTKLGDEVATHVREEYSTFDWIMDGLLTRAGFKIQSKEILEGVIGKYLCVKESEAAQPSPAAYPDRRANASSGSA